MKTKVDKLDVDKLVLAPIDLSKLNDVVKNNVAIKDGYNAKIKKVEDKIPDIINLPTNTTANAEINEVKGKLPSITNLTTTTEIEINEIENKVTTDHNRDKYITIQEFNKLTSEYFNARLVQANLASKVILLIS